MNQKSLIGEWLRGLPPALREEFEERAGIMEFDGGLSRECAEYASMAVLFRRHPLRAHGLHLVRVGPSRYLLTNDPGCPGSPTGDLRQCDLPSVIRELGGAVVLEAPKTEIPGVSEMKDS